MTKEVKKSLEMTDEVKATTSNGNDEDCRELVKLVAVRRKKIPKYCAEIERDCKQYEIDLQLNASHEPLVPPDEIRCSLPDEDTKQYMKFLSEKQDNTNENCQEMNSAIKSLQEVAVLYRLKKLEIKSKNCLDEFKLQ